MKNYVFIYIRIFLYSGIIFFVGCNIGPKYKNPQIAIPKSYSVVLEEDKNSDIKNWWKVFNDNVSSTN